MRILTLLAFMAAPILAAEENKESVEYKGYWRLGFNSAGDVFQNAPDAQGQHNIFFDVPTTRHANQPNYFWLSVKKTFKSGAAAAVKLDHAGNVPHHEGNWGEADSNVIQVRDLYLELPISAGSHVWAGSKYLEYEDVRQFDVLNPFNVNAHGVGLKTGSWENVVSATKEGFDLISDPEGKKDTFQRRVTYHTRYEHKLSESSAIKPMLNFTKHGEVPGNKSATDGSQRHIKDNYDYIVGGVYSFWSDSSWNNLTFWMQAKPVDSFGDDKDHDNHYGLSLSSSHDFGGFGALVSVWAQQDSFANEKAVWKVENDTTVADGTNTTKSTTKISLGAQPVYYMTDKLHLALDLNQTFKTKKTSAGDFDSTLITPIVRYSTDKSTLGVPQVYSSVTFGAYDWKAKTDINGQQTKHLVTTQTGFEIWF